jgi:GNAT superfamily N-acetyltransferase
MVSARSIKVVPAEVNDILPWLRLAVEVEYIFGPMPGLDAILARKVAQKRAYCVHYLPGRLAGAMLLGGAEGGYWIRWLAVDSDRRNLGVGKALVEVALKTFPSGSKVYVDTFADDTKDGKAARRLYEGCGFTPFSLVREGGIERLRLCRKTLLA